MPVDYRSGGRKSSSSVRAFSIAEEIRSRFDFKFHFVGLTFFLRILDSSVGEHERIWAPWRLSYVQATDQEPPSAAPKLDFLPDADPDCFICQAVVDSDSRGRLVVSQGEVSLTILNRYPYNNGHLLVAPRRHRGRSRRSHPGRTSRNGSDNHPPGCGLLRKELRAEGFNVGLNLGRVGGAGLPGHLHWHIVPRWNGDTNFMPALAGVRVIPQSLDALWELLTERISHPAREPRSPYWTSIHSLGNNASDRDLPCRGSKYSSFGGISGKSRLAPFAWALPFA